MNFRENISVALRAIRANFLRSVLTLLIIAFGIAALVAILTALDVLLISLSDSFSGIGANTFNIERKGESLGGNRRGKRSKRGDVISLKQALKFKEQYDFPSTVSVSLGCTSLATIKHKKEKSNPNVTVIGCDAEYMKVRGYNFSHGRSFSKTEEEEGSHKAIIGMDLVNLLFDEKPESAIGKTISNGSVKYRVIGVLESKGASMTSNEDRSILIPLENAKRYYDTPNRNYDLSVMVSDATLMEEAIAEAVGVFRNVRGIKAGQDNDFETFKSDGIMEILKENTVVIRLSVIVIGIITLIGAAIGLMNIMLVSVTERTKEIGICKALGATRANILLQFLTEAIVISILGGMFGILGGMLFGNLVALFLGGKFIIPWMWIFVGFSLCFSVGLLSGLYPAFKASGLDPIESLRYE